MLAGLKCLGSSLLPLIKMDVIFTFLQVLGSSSDLHNLSKIRVASEKHLPTLLAILDAHHQRPPTCTG